MKKDNLAIGIICGILYGLITRGIFALEILNNSASSGLMTISFMFIVPFVVGLIIAYQSKAARTGSKLAAAIFAITGMTVFTLISGSEGLICAIMALPVFLIMACFGVGIGDVVFRKSRNKLFASSLLLMPYILAPVERVLGLKDKVFIERTSIEITANVEQVWDNITRVKKITKEENNVSLFQVMGFPKPIEAELDTVAVGGIRKAIFEKGLFFTETVTQVTQFKILAFNIEADPGSIPPKALDEHVMVGGTYFDVLEGRYEIEKVDNRLVKLHLSSEFRLSTPFNWYSGMWSKIIMRDIQKNILEIIKKRSEENP